VQPVTIVLYGATGYTGRLVADELARRHGGRFRSKFSGRLAEVRLDGARLALLKPETYMNESGRSIAAATRFFKADAGALLVVHDDVDLEEGRLQARRGGGLAGHNGLRSIAQALGSQDFLRLRIGVGRPGRGDRRSVADYVLAPFGEETDVDALVARAADAVETIARDGIEAGQQRFN
jgi:PTH1 family peptidyl-tRNA hydrolase